MKRFSQIKFLFQVFTVLSLCFLLGSLSAWENGQISLLLLVLQCGLFSATALASYKLSSYGNRRRLRQRVRRVAAYLPHQRLAHSRPV